MASGIATQRNDAASYLKTALAILILGLGVCFIVFFMSAQRAARRDFISYWSAGQQLVHRQDPYDAGAILRIEKSAGFQGSRAFFMRNAPNAFLLAYPLGFLSARAGVILWTLAIVAALMLSIRLIWTMHGRPDDRLHLAGYLFAPAVACLLAAQTAIFILLGVTLFLYFHKTRPVAAGAALLLLTFKPHLFVPFGIVLLAWIVLKRAWPILISASCAVALALLFAYLADPHCWQQYFHMAKREHLASELLPTTSLLFRLLIDRGAFWLQFVPAFAAGVWAVRYFFTHRRDWNWHSHGLLLLLVSVLVAPYAWFSDEAILLPAILAGLYTLRDRGRSAVPFGIIAGIALIEVFFTQDMATFHFIWTAPAWLLWYLHATRRTRSHTA